MTRVIAGTARGRRLSVPAHGTRPTSDRVREAMFSSLEATDSLAGARVLDLYAGSGALGIEAVSRGAASVTLIENDRAAAEICRENATVVGNAFAKVLLGDVGRLVKGPPPDAPFDLVFIDPPYELANVEVASVIADLAASGWLTARAELVVERPTGPELAWPASFQATRRRRYGGTVLWYGRMAGE